MVSGRNVTLTMRAPPTEAIVSKSFRVLSASARGWRHHGAKRLYRDDASKILICLLGLIKLRKRNDNNLLGPLRLNRVTLPQCCISCCISHVCDALYYIYRCIFIVLGSNFQNFVRFFCKKYTQRSWQPVILVTSSRHFNLPPYTYF